VSSDHPPGANTPARNPGLGGGGGLLWWVSEWVGGWEGAWVGSPLWEGRSGEERRGEERSGC